MSADRRLLSIHEAAHAVTGVRLGFRVARVSIDQATVDRESVAHGGHVGDASGACVLDEPVAAPGANWRDPRRWRTLENEIAMGLAAVVAEARQLGISVYAAPSWTHEYELARRLAALRGLPGHEITPFLAWLLERADRLCDWWWPEIQALAAHLQSFGTLEGYQVHAFLANRRIPEASCS